MKKKVKLAFQMLEKEMKRLDKKEMERYNGGRDESTLINNNDIAFFFNDIHKDSFSMMSNFSPLSSRTTGHGGSGYGFNSYLHLPNDGGPTDPRLEGIVRKFNENNYKIQENNREIAQLRASGNNSSDNLNSPTYSYGDRRETIGYDIWNFYNIYRGNRKIESLTSENNRLSQENEKLADEWQRIISSQK